MKATKTICDFCGVGYCGMVVYIEKDKIIKVTGDIENSLSKGTLCPIGLSSIDIEYSPDRIIYPMLKVSGLWKKISWSKALDLIAKRLTDIKDKYGPEALVVHLGFARSSQAQIAREYLAYKLAELYGTPNLTSNSYVCGGPRRLGAYYVFGYHIASPDYDNARCIIFWGKKTNLPPHFAIKVSSLLKKGTKIIVIDPRKTSIAKKSSLHLQLRPGTDGALALSILNVIIKNKLFDSKFVEKWTLGFEDLKKLVADYPPKRVEEITWVPEEKIIEAATIYAKNKPSCIAHGNGLDHHTNNFDAIRAIFSLVALTGNVDVAGGNLLKTHESQLLKTEKIIYKSKPIGQEFLPVFYQYGIPKAHLPSVWNAILTEKPYPVKAMFNIGANPAVSAANTHIVKEALKKLEFLVVIDLFMTETAKVADIFLPTTTFFEVENNSKTKIINPLGECWPDVKIIIELAKRLGFEKEFPLNIYEAIEEYSKSFPANSITEYKKHEKTGFPTASGKIELYSRVLKNAGLKPLPNYIEPAESPITNIKLAKGYPLILITGERLSMFTHSQFRNIPKLRKLMQNNILELNPETAAKFKIRDKESITVESPRGKIQLQAKVTENIQSGVVSTYPGFTDANANNLIDHQTFNPVTGSPALRSTLCRLKK